MTVISVITPTYRRPMLVERAVRSILAQTLRSFGVLVALDGLDDGTLAVIDALDDPRTRVIAG
jgi:glycosyltransferase involved in cell wall biosynthesis